MKTNNTEESDTLNEKPIIKSDKCLRNVVNANVSTNNEWLIIVALFTWLGGIVIAKGFWCTLFAICPLYAWYLFIEHLFKYIHFI